MIKLEKLYDKVNNYFKVKKSENFTMQAYLEDRLLNDDNYTNISSKLGKLNYEIAMLDFNGNSENTTKLKEERDRLVKEKLVIYNKYLKELNFSYSCNLCKDTGIYKNKRCKCYYALLTKYTLESLNVKERVYPTFSSEIPNGLEKHYEISKKYVEKFPNTEVKNFVFLGKVGTGKTYLASTIVGELNKKKALTVFLTSNELNSIFLKLHRQEIDRELVFDILTACDLLVIDDLGTEPLYNNVTAEYLLAIISERLDKNKHFIITTNLTTSEILSRYNERFLSRISDKKSTAIIPFNGKDLRI